MIEGSTAKRFIGDKNGLRCVGHSVIDVSYLQEGCACAFEEAHRTMFIFSGHASGIAESVFRQGRLGYKPVLCLEQLRELIKYGSEISLSKKIDIVGFDACHMALLEIAYDIREYARYLIASQDYEEKDGWNYSLLSPLLAHDRSSEICRLFIHGLDGDLRIKRQTHYSLSAMDLSYAQHVAGVLNELANSFGPLLGDKLFLDALWSARMQKNGSGPFMYCDIVAFLEKFCDELDLLVSTDDIERVKKASIDVIVATHSLVIAHCSGRESSWAHGCSLYFPLIPIESSYKSLFARENQWDPLIFKAQGKQHRTQLV